MQRSCEMFCFILRPTATTQNINNKMGPYCFIEFLSFAPLADPILEQNKLQISNHSA